MMMKSAIPFARNIVNRLPVGRGGITVIDLTGGANQHPRLKGSVACATGASIRVRRGRAAAGGGGYRDRALWGGRKRAAAAAAAAAAGARSFRKSVRYRNRPPRSRRE